MKLIQTLEVGKVKFHIVKDNHGYWGINDKYVENMKIAHGINGLEGNLANSYIETIRLCWLSAKRNTIQYHLINWKMSLIRLALRKLGQEQSTFI